MPIENILYFLIDDNKNVRPKFHPLRNMYKSHKMEKFELENESQYQEAENGTCAIRLQMFESML